MDLRFSACVLCLLALPATAIKCPGSASSIHASCEVTVTFSNSCADVQEEMLARMNGVDGWVDPHNAGDYQVVSDSVALIEGTHLTGNHKYTDKFDVTFADSGSGCKVTGCSESQVFSVIDYSTNYCNLRNLYCGSDAGCKFVKHELSFTEKLGSCLSHDSSKCVVNPDETKFSRALPFFEGTFLSGGDDCPVVTTQPDFDVESFISAKWYIQQQMPITYLPKEQNYCVNAMYTKKDKSIFGYTIAVHNYAQEQDGTPHDSGSSICAMPDSSGDPAKLNVGPCFLPPVSGVTTGPYWVLAYNADEGYALVSGGQPTIKTANGCKTGSGVNGSGLWIFTRAQQRDEALISKVRDIAKAKGFDLSVLNDVDQTNCAKKLL